MRRIIILFLFIPQLISPAGHNAEGPTGSKARSGTTKAATAWHYEPAPGKLVAIWPADGSCLKESYSIYRKKYGFTGAGIIQINYSQNSPYQRALDAGFDARNIMIMTWGTTYVDAVKELPAGYYYLDEPVEHDCSGHSTIGDHVYTPAELADRRAYVHDLRPDSKYVIGGYKRCSHLQLAAGSADNIMYTSYVNWNSMWLPVCHVNIGYGDDMEAPWSEGSGNQSDSWSDMRSKFGAKFNMTWMNGRGDEYQDLFHAANVLGLEGVWLYARQGLGPDSAATLESFCQAAVAKGWLKMVDDFIPAPANLASKKAEDGHCIKLTWTNLSENEKGFVIERKLLSSGSYSELAQTGPACQSFTDSTAEEGKVYSYRIKAFNDFYSSEYSNESVISAPIVPHLTYPEDGAKDMPLNLNFNWTAIPEAESYSFEISEDKIFSNRFFSDTLLYKPEAELKNLKDGSRYYWRVSAKDSLGIRTYSETGSFSTLLLSPGGLKAEALKGGRISLSWTDNSQSEEGYSVERKLSNDFQYLLLATLAENARSYTDSLLEKNSFTYRVRAFNQITSSVYSNEASASTITGVSQKEAVPVDYTLFQNHPNPYNPSTKISYSLPEESRVRLLIYNSIGGIVKILVDKVEEAGSHELDFNGSDLSSGIYFYLLEAGPLRGTASYRAARKMILLK